MDWSVDGQNPDFLAATRMATLSPRVVSQILERLELRPGMRVLDVGCGSGEYVFRLGQQVEGVTFVGLEYDPAFVRFANMRAQGQLEGPYEPLNPANTYAFVQGDGLALPFEDMAFDAVISHTYLTAIPDYVAALGEMCRVCKPGGQVSSVTVLGDDFGGVGRVQLMPWMMAPADAALSAKVEALAKSADAGMNLTAGIPPKKVPVTFAWIGLEQVSALPLGQYFCLSDAATTPWDYERYVELLYAMELRKIDQLRQIPEIDGGLTAGEWESYQDLATRRREELLAMQGANREWDWFASAALLVCGRVPECGMVEVAEVLSDETLPARSLREVVASTGAQFDECYRQLGPGRCCYVELRAAESPIVGKYGFTPSLALEEALCALLAPPFKDGKFMASEDLAQKLEAELLCADVEERLHGLLLGDAGLKPLSDERAYVVPSVYETVAEAVQMGHTVRFFYSDLAPDMSVVVAEMTGERGPVRAMAAHPEFGVAVRRALSRAFAGLSR